MKLIIGYHLDSAAYPDALLDKEAVVGTAVTGLQGLVGVLETQLGMVLPAIPETRRIAEWEDRIRRLDDQQRQANGRPVAFYKSFEVDPWNTAKELLQRRDELVLAGWDPTVHQGEGRMLETLAAIEMQSVGQSPGFADRVRDLLQRLEQPAQLELKELIILDDETLWEPWFDKLIAALRNHGVAIEIDGTSQDQYAAQMDETESDLALLRKARNGQSPSNEVKGDGSLVLVRAETEWDAADGFSSWLETYGSNQTVVIHQQPSITLDEMMHKRGLPGLGADKPSPWRSILQVLPLTIETYWKPLRLSHLMQLLTLPTSPVPSKIRYRLANAICNAPGVGGPLWFKAIDEGHTAYEKGWQERALDADEIKKRRKNIEGRLKVWISHDTYDPNEGIPQDVLIFICHKMEQWAVSQMALTDDALYGVAADVASQVADAVKALNMRRVPRLHVARILDSVLSQGVHLHELEREASTWHVVKHPGQIYEPVDTVLWWGFCVGGSSGKKTWTAKERTWLANHGVVLPDESLNRRREAAAWHRAVNMAKRQLILFAPANVQGEEVNIHPLWEEIKHSVAAQSEIEQRIVFDASRLRKESRPGFISEGHERIALNRKFLPKPIREWRAPSDTVMPRETESATSFDMLLGCPLAWTLQYQAKVRSSSVLSVPSEPIMLGLLAHEVLRSLLTQSKRWDPADAKLRAGTLFDELIEGYAAPLLEPQNSTLREETKWRLQQSIERFFTILSDTGIQIEHTEHELRRPWTDGVDVAGRLDLITKTRSGKSMVIDAKWSRHPKGYRNRLEQMSTQLTLYHWLMAGDADDELPVAYFMLRNGELFTHPHADIPVEYHVEGPNFVESLTVLKREVESAWGRLKEGTVVAAGIPGEAVETDPLVEPPCRYCEFKNLCGIGGVTA